MKRGTEEDDGVELPDSETMKDLGQDHYKYLRVLEAIEITMKVLTS